MAARDRTRTRLRRLLDLLKDKKTLLIVMQDHPDPDAVASAVALRHIANQKFGITCSLAHGGSIGRAENRALVRYLDLNLRSVLELAPDKFDLVALVDTQPATGNNSLPAEARVDIVFDHHPLRRGTRGAAFRDVRREYGATATILYEYLAALKLEPGIPLATALCYAIRSDTQDLGRESTRADIEAYVALYPLANKRMLGRIQREPEPLEYFQALALALTNAIVYGRCVVTSLGEVAVPETVAEVADLLLRYEAVSWAFAQGTHADELYLSLRTTEAEMDAGKVMHKLVARLGTGGGHQAMAGGQVPLPGLSAPDRRNIERSLLRRLLRRLHVRKREGRSLLAKG